MANNLSLVATLVEEVADLLRHSNLDVRILDWVGMAYSDMAQRMVMAPFIQSKSLTFSDDNAVAVSDLNGTPIALVVVDDNELVWTPKYVTPADFSRIKNSGDPFSTAAVQPYFWSIMNEGSTSSLFLYPSTSGDSIATLFYSGPYAASAPTGATTYALAYHFEHVLIWGAASIGAAMIKPQAYPIFKGEYEQSLQDMAMIMGYHPDAVPVLRGIDGAYAGTRRMMAPPRFPTNIS